MDIALVIDRLRPGADWGRADSYSGLFKSWRDKLQALPTQTEIDAEWVVILAEALPAARAAAKARVDAAAETARLAFITNGSGQALVYEAKRRESADCLAKHTASSPPGFGVYPMLDAEVGITLNVGSEATKNAYEVAAAVDGMASAWIAAGAAIETVRLTAKRDIAAATDQAAIDTILASLTWPQP